MRRRSILVGAAIGALLVATVLLAGPRGVGEAGPEGTLALRRLLVAYGRTLATASSLPDPPATVVLMADLRDAGQETEILGWLRRGGRLVLADPDSQLLPFLAIESGAPAPAGRIGPGCAVPETRGVDAIEALGNDGFAAHDPAAVACFSRDDGALAIVQDVGLGRAIVLADRSVLSNELLDRSDNAVFALQAIPNGPVLFAPPLPPGAAAPRRGVWASLPLAARVCIFELGLALVAFAAVRARRLGRPVAEEPLVPISSGELVRATGRLLRSSRDAPYAGRVLRRAMIGRLARRLGAPAASGKELVVSLSRSGAGAEPDLDRLISGPDPKTDAELITLGRDLEQLRRRVEGDATEYDEVPAQVKVT